MKLAIFAEPGRQSYLAPLVKARAESVFYDDYDRFIRALSQGDWDAVLVAHKGAAGMQSVRAARILLRQVPVAWLTDDGGFVEESYRVGCTFFSAEVITQDLILAALQRCESERGN